MGVQIQGDTGNVIATKGTYSGNVTIGGTLTYEDVTNVDSIGLVTARNGIEVGASPGVAASISVDGNMIVSGITTIGGDIKVGSGVTIGKDGHLFATGVTTSSTVKVGAAVTISESGIEASGIGITCANINGTQIGGRRNLIINGAMNIAQRVTSSTDSGFATVDRFRLLYSGHDEAITQQQVDLDSSDTGPYEKGFRKAFKVTNGNQTSGAGGTDYAQLLTTIEAQDIASSGWYYTSSTSFVTLSFWVKSSIAQNFYGAVRTQDGTVRSFPFETGSLTANTWKKVIIKIPGDSSSTYNNDSGSGLQIFFWAFRGTDYTGSVTLNQWNTWNTNTGTPDMTSTWWTTNDSTIEFTGFQLEVGTEATAFEHRMHGEELALCQRYFFNITGDSNVRTGVLGYANSSSEFRAAVYFPVTMRGAPTFTGSTTAMVVDSADDSASFNVNTISMSAVPGNFQAVVEVSTSSMTAGQCGQLEFRASDGFMNFDAEI